MRGRTFQSPVKYFLKQRLEYLWITSIHRFGQGRFWNNLHAEVIQPVMVCKKTVFTAVPYIFEIVIFVLLFELALIVFLNYPFPVFPFR